MTRTCASFAGLFACLIAGRLPAAAQTLEDKVSRARAMQAQSAMGLDQATIDSLLYERDRESVSGARGREGRAGMLPRLETVLPDSLVAGPELPDSLAPEQADSSRGRRTGRRMQAHPIPRRYEQRIFRTLDRSAFATSSGAVGRDYVLGQGDEVQVSLWGDREKVYNLALNLEGKVFLEGVGLVPLAGLNLNEAEKRLRERLAKVYSGINRGTTHVDITVGRPGPTKVFVLGEVKVPGGYTFSGQASVLTAMYFAQGPTDIGTVRNLQLTRGGARHVLDLYKYLIKGESLTPGVLQDGDILHSSRAEILVEIEGDVGRPAVYELRKGEGVRELLEFAGRINPTAAQHKMTLQRVSDSGKVVYMDLPSPQEVLAGKTPFPLVDGDRVLVEKSTELSRNFLTITGPVKYPGAYASDGVRTAAHLIEKAGGLREDAFLGRIHVVRFRPDGSSMLLAFSLDSSRSDSIPLEPRDNVILYSLKEMYLPDSVEISGAVFNPGRYEYRQGMSAEDLVMQAGGFLPHHEKGRIRVFRGGALERNVNQVDIRVHESLSASERRYLLQPNDFVQVPEDPRWYGKEIVTLSGLFEHPGKYALLYPQEKLTSVINRAGGFKTNAYISGGRFYRSKDSVGRVGVDLTVAIAKPRSKANIGLVGGDSIYIPERSNTVKVIGEVGFETSVLFKEGASVEYYVERAGGLTRRSEENRIVVQYANGETGRDGYFNRKPDAGSVIYVPQGPEPKPIDWVAGINALLGTLSVGAALVLSVIAINSQI